MEIKLSFIQVARKEKRLGTAVKRDSEYGVGEHRTMGTRHGEEGMTLL